MTQDKKTETQNETVSTEEKVSSKEDSDSVNIAPWLITITVIACISLGIGLWNRFKPAQDETRVLDLAGISLTYQQQAKNQGLQDGVTNEQRAAILQNYQAKMNTLQQIVEEYVHECACNVFVKSAIVGRGNNVKDITSEIMNRLDKRIPASATVVAPPKSASNTASTPETAEGGATPVDLK